MAYQQDSNIENEIQEGNTNESDIQAPIVGYEVVEARKRFTVYQISVNLSDGRSWFVFRRYSDFARLDENLRKLYADELRDVELPPKRYLGDNFSDVFIEMRKRSLQKYLDKVLQNQELCWTQPIIEFLCLDDPPGPYDSLQESRAFIESLEETVTGMKMKYSEVDSELKLAKAQLRSTLSHKRALLVALRAERVLNGKPSHDNDDAALISEYLGHPSVSKIDLQSFTKEEQLLKHKISRSRNYKSNVASQLDLTFVSRNNSTSSEDNSRRTRSVSDLPDASQRHKVSNRHLPSNNRRGKSVIDKFMRQSTDALEQIRQSVRQKLGRWEDDSTDPSTNDNSKDPSTNGIERD